MKILVDINHPAHVHFFKNAIIKLQQSGHKVVVTSREKECTIELLEQLNVSHIPLSVQKGNGITGLLKELIIKDKNLYHIVKKEKPDILASLGGTFVSHVGKLTNCPSIVFYDTENAKLQNLITYPFASLVVVPDCYESWLPTNHIRYKGYHELAYLHPDYFTPDYELAIKNGLSDQKPTYLLRLVSWQANHDIGETGWNLTLLEKIIHKLSAMGKVLISTETKLPPEFEQYVYKGAVNQLHHVLAFAQLYLGESATLASEAAVLGIPSIYAAETDRGYTNEQEKKYSLVKNIHNLDWKVIENAIDTMLESGPEFFSQQRQKLLDDTIDVNQLIINTILTFPDHQRNQ